MTTDPDAPLVVLVHGSLDRAGSFARVLRRLRDLHTLVYDRRGYHRSRDVVPVHETLDGHVDDLLAVIDGRPAVVVGHSYGGDIALGAALRPGGPTPILAVGRLRAADAVARHLGHPVRSARQPRPRPRTTRDWSPSGSSGAWSGTRPGNGCPKRPRTPGAADGPALAAELAAIRGDRPPFDVTKLTVPVVFGRGIRVAPPSPGVGGVAGRAHVPGAELVEIAGAGHGAHLTPPDAFANFVRTAMARPPSPVPARPGPSPARTERHAPSRHRLVRAHRHRPGRCGPESWRHRYPTGPPCHRRSAPWSGRRRRCGLGPVERHHRHRCPRRRRAVRRGRPPGRSRCRRQAVEPRPQAPEIIGSRTRATGLLARTVADLAPRPPVLVSASAVGYYGDRGDEVLTEQSSAGSGFLADVCLAWEGATAPAVDAGIRTVVLRTGIVLSASGGALARQLPLFRLGVGGRIGTGRQYRSWITLDDEVAAILHCLGDATLSGPVNAVAPHPATDAELAKALGHALHRPSFMVVPAPALKLVLGSEMADRHGPGRPARTSRAPDRRRIHLRAPRPRRGGALGSDRVLTGSGQTGPVVAWRGCRTSLSPLPESSLAPATSGDVHSTISPATTTRMATTSTGRRHPAVSSRSWNR